MAIRCLIIDDEPLARDLIREYLNDFGPEVELIGEAEKGTQAVKMINESKPDLIFLDVQMPGMNGFEVLENIEAQPMVIFSTAYDQYAIQAFDKNAIDYLLKPIDQERFNVSLRRVMDRKGEDQGIRDMLEQLTGPESGEYLKQVFVQKSEKLLNLPVGDILYLEASGDYTVISTAKDQYLSSSGISKLEQKLNPERFIRIHRSTIINIDHLTEIEKHFNGNLVVKMNNAKTFPVSRTYAKVIKKRVV